MNTTARLLAAICLVLQLAACGEHLGDYSVETVKLVTDTSIPAEHRPSPTYGEYLEIQLASQTNLVEIGDKLDGVYVDADSCPLHDPNGFIAFGPFGDDGQDLGVPSAAPALRVHRDGRSRYRIFLAVGYRGRPATKPGQIELPTYDLRNANRDVCLRLSAPGYNLIKSRSDTIRVPVSVIAAALKQGGFTAQRSSS
ncbi:MAG: hypothetical protein ABIO43_07795 [Sphingomicrobium sp.]